MCDSDDAPPCGGRVANGGEVPFETPSGVVLLLRNTRKGTRLFSPAGPEIGLFPDEMIAKCAAVLLSRDSLFVGAMLCPSLATMEARLSPLVGQDSPPCGP